MIRCSCTLAIATETKDPAAAGDTDAEVQGLLSTLLPPGAETVELADFFLWLWNVCPHALNGFIAWTRLQGIDHGDDKAYEAPRVLDAIAELAIAKEVKAQREFLLPAVPTLVCLIDDDDTIVYTPCSNTPARLRSSPRSGPG